MREEIRVTHKRREGERGGERAAFLARCMSTGTISLSPFAGGVEARRGEEGWVEGGRELVCLLTLLVWLCCLFLFSGKRRRRGRRAGSKKGRKLVRLTARCQIKLLASLCYWACSLLYVLLCHSLSLSVFITYLLAAFSPQSIRLPLLTSYVHSSFLHSSSLFLLFPLSPFFCSSFSSLLTLLPVLVTCLPACVTRFHA